MGAPSKDHSILAPESCTYPNPSNPSSNNDKSENSRLQVSETLSARGSNNSAKDNLGETQVLAPLPDLANTQILAADTNSGNNFKRPRSSTDENDVTEKPPTKQLLLSDHTERNTEKSKINTANSPNMFESSCSNSSVASASVNNINKPSCQFNNLPKNSDDNDNEDDDDDDMFGFGSLKNKKKRKASPEESQLTQKEKKRQRENDEEDMFGLQEITKKKANKKTLDVDESSQKEMVEDTNPTKQTEEIKDDDTEI